MKNISSLAFFVILFLGLGIVALMALPDGVTGGLQPAPALVGGAAASSEMAAAQEPADVQAVSGGNANWVALPLENPALTIASELKTEMENGSGVTVGAVQEWDSASQSYLTYESNPGDDFALQTGGVYRVTVDGGGTGAVWSLVGDVPDPAVFSYLLEETSGSDFNWIMLPLDLGSVTLASELAAHIEANSSGSVTVDAIQGWNATAQSYQSYNAVPFPAGDFALRIGMPYRVSVSSVQGGAVTWPN